MIILVCVEKGCLSISTLQAKIYLSDPMRISKESTEGSAVFAKEKFANRKLSHGDC